MNPYFSWLDWSVLAAYFAATMIIGLYFYRQSRTVDAFTAANRRVPGWAVGLSIFGTYVSSISFLALPGKAFADNWNPFVFSLSLPIATWAAVRWFLPYYRATGEVSAYSHLEHRFGPWARIYASVFFLLTQLARLGAVTYLMALPLAMLLHADLSLIILITGLTTTLYAFVGGVLAVIWTDVMQSIVLIAGAVLCAILLMIGLPEGPGQLFAIGIEHHKFSLGSFGTSLATPTFWVVLAYGLAINLQNFGIDQAYIQRYLASPTDHEAKKSVWLGGLLYIPVSAVFFFIGTGLFAYYQVHPQGMAEVRTFVAEQKLMQLNVAPGAPDYAERRDTLVRDLPESQVGDKVFPHFIGAHLPAGLRGLLIAAIFAAAMSTLSGSLNASATLIMRDFYQRYLRRDATERHSMLVLYGGTIAWGVGGTAVALSLVGLPENALDTWWKLSGIAGGGMLGLFLLGLISRRAGNPAAIAAVVLGLGVIAWMTLGKYLPEKVRSPFHAFLIPVFGALAILLAGIAITRVRTWIVGANDDSIGK
jgi:solute:Na+ symporter, SSS family